MRSGFSVSLKIVLVSALLLMIAGVLTTLLMNSQGTFSGIAADKIDDSEKKLAENRASNSGTSSASTSFVNTGTRKQLDSGQGKIQYLGDIGQNSYFEYRSGDGANTVTGQATGSADSGNQPTECGQDDMIGVKPYKQVSEDAHPCTYSDILETDGGRKKAVMCGHSSSGANLGVGEPDTSAEKICKNSGNMEKASQICESLSIELLKDGKVITPAGGLKTSFQKYSSVFTTDTQIGFRGKGSGCKNLKEYELRLEHFYTGSHRTSQSGPKTGSDFESWFGAKVPFEGKYKVELTVTDQNGRTMRTVKPFEVSRAENYPPIVSGHRGAGTDLAPGNTIMSFKKAVNMNLDYVEFDVMRTQDRNEFVVVHYDKGDSTWNKLRNLYDRTIAEASGKNVYPEKESKDYLTTLPSYKNYEPANVPESYTKQQVREEAPTIPGFKRVLTYFSDKDTILRVELKGSTKWEEETARNLAKKVPEHMRDRVIFLSLSHPENCPPEDNNPCSYPGLKAIKDVDSDFRTEAGWKGVLGGSAWALSDALKQAEKANVDYISNYADLDPTKYTVEKFMEEARNRGITPVPNVGGVPAEKELLRYYQPLWFSGDRPDLIKGMVKNQYKQGKIQDRDWSELKSGDGYQAGQSCGGRRSAVCRRTCSETNMRDQSCGRYFYCCSQ